jgi:hypothetical protein
VQYIEPNFGVALLPSFPAQFFVYSVARDEHQQAKKAAVVVICPKETLGCVWIYIATLMPRKEESLLLHLGVKCFSLIFTSTGSLGSLVAHTLTYTRIGITSRRLHKRFRSLLQRLTCISKLLRAVDAATQYARFLSIRQFPM